MMTRLLKKVPGARRFAGMLGLNPSQAHYRAFLLKMLPPNSVGAEIGVHKGDFSSLILQTVTPRELHLVDPWHYEEAETYNEALYGGKARDGQAEMDERYEAVRLRFEPHIRSGQVKIHRGFSSPVLQGFPDDYFDWVYIDGNHTYEFVLQDLEVSLQKTTPGGLITGDDYGDGGWWQGGVKKAVDAFVQNQPVQLVAIRDGQFVLRKRGRD